MTKNELRFTISSHFQAGDNIVWLDTKFLKLKVPEMFNLEWGEFTRDLEIKRPGQKIITLYSDFHQLDNITNKF